MDEVIEVDNIVNSQAGPSVIVINEVMVIDRHVI